MNIKNTFLTLLMLAVLLGCSTINYMEPQTGDLSRVRFATGETDVVVVRAYENTDCVGERELMRLRNGVLMNSSPKSLGIPLQDYSKNAFKEFYFPSNKEKIVMFVGAVQQGDKVFSCGVPVNLGFLEKNKDYELFYKMGFSGCTVTASEIQPSSLGGAIKNTFKTYSNSQQGLGAECVALFKKQRLY